MDTLFGMRIVFSVQSVLSAQFTGASYSNADGIYGGVGGWVCWCNLIKVLQQQGSCRCKHVTTRQDHHNIHCCLATKTTTLLVTQSKCVQQIAFGVLSIRFNRIINLHSFLLGYD